MDNFILLIVGIIGLWGGTELTVRKAIILTRRLNVSSLFIGLTVLAFGTDLPELFVAINGALHNAKGIDSSGVIVGNAIGSSVGQISIVIGLIATLHFLTIGKLQIRYLGIELIGSVILLALVSFDYVVTWNDGAILIIAFLIYFFTHWERERNRKIDLEVGQKATSGNFIQSALLVLGLAIVGYSSELTVDSALDLAEMWGFKQTFIGAIIIGLGTSLPELAISISAIMKEKPALSVGNIIGSNIFDLLIPIGVASLIADIKMDRQTLLFDMPFLLVISIVVIWFLSRKRGLQKSEGFVMAGLYIIYAVTKFFL